MALNDDHNALIDSFRHWVEAAVGKLRLFGERQQQDREDRTTLATRWGMDKDLWIEVAIRPLIPQIRVGIVTTDRWKSEDLEQMIEDSGDTMQEFIELGFDTVDLDWPDPPVEHYRHEGRFFYFATPLELQSLDELNDAAVRDKTVRMARGYHCAFTGQATG